MFLLLRSSPNQAKVGETIFEKDGLGDGFKYFFKTFIPIWGNDRI